MVKVQKYKQCTNAKKYKNTKEGMQQSNPISLCATLHMAPFPRKGERLVMLVHSLNSPIQDNTIELTLTTQHNSTILFTGGLPLFTRNDVTC